VKVLDLLLLCASFVAAQGPPYPYSVDLSWKLSTDKTVTTQNVSRAAYAAGVCGAFSVIASGLAPTANSFVDNSPVSGAAYCYEVEAIAPDGTFTSQPVANVQIPPDPPTGMAASVTAPSQVQASVKKAK